MWRLNKALYGLKSAPKAWAQHLASVLKSLGWERSVLDECVFFKRNTTKKDTFPISGIIVAYVDDLIVSGHKLTVTTFYKKFEKSCTCSEPEELAVGTKPITYLGFDYTRYKD